MVTSGIYRFTRNPMYLGFLLVLAGWAMSSLQCVGVRTPSSVRVVHESISNRTGRKGLGRQILACTTRRVPFTAEQMFAVVADVERYPEFVPLCEQLVVKHARGRQHAHDAHRHHECRLSRHPRDLYQPRHAAARSATRSTSSRSTGPFAHLTNRWRFRDVPGGSEIYFHIDYAFASRMLALLMGAVFDKAVRKYTEAFEARARALYGTSATVADSS